MAQGKRTSLAVRALALLFALALAALAARLWLRHSSADAETAAAGAADVPDQPVAEGYETAPPLHGPFSDADRERLRELLREPPGAPK